MIQLLESSKRGEANHGWLQSRHTFSFADYYNPAHMGFRSLRVINEDHIKGGMGFGTHPHRDMEIITYMMSGALEHQDSMGNTAVIRPGEVQHMSAGTGVRHSEFNHFKDQEAHLFQIWILPEKLGIPPAYGQKAFAADLAEKNLVLVASRDGHAGSLPINQDAEVYLSRLKRPLSFPLRSGRGLWVQVLKGQVSSSGLSLNAGDAVVIENESAFEAAAAGPDTELMIFDLK